MYGICKSFIKNNKSFTYTENFYKNTPIFMIYVKLFQHIFPYHKDKNKIVFPLKKEAKLKLL